MSIIRFGVPGRWLEDADAAALSMSCENRTLGASLSDNVRPAIAPECRLPSSDEGASPPVLSAIAILLSELHSEIDGVLYEPQ